MIRKTFTLILFILGSIGSVSAQQGKRDTVYTFPFHMDSRLIVFEGELNGQLTYFAFDTGAAIGLADESFVQNERIKARKKVMMMRDTNNEIARVGTGKSKQVKLGGFKINNVESLILSMPYLSCQNYYLLGSNVIKLLNWEIDFDSNLIRVSDGPFPVEPQYLPLPVTYQSSRPFTSLSFDGMALSNVLIDTGYSRILDVDNSSSLMKSYIEEKEKLGRTNTNISLSTGAAGEKLEETIQILVDTLLVNGQKILGVPTDFIETKSSKIGIGFFKMMSHKTIINNSESTYYLDVRADYEFEKPFLLNLQYTGNQVVIAGKSLEKDPLFERVSIGDEVVSINGNPTVNFSKECDFIQWYFNYNEDEMTIQTKGGASLTFNRTTLK